MTYQADEKAAAKRAADVRKDKPDIWVPVNAGDTIIGTVTRVDAGWSDQKNDFYPILEIEVESADGYAEGDMLKVHAFRSVLCSEVLKTRPVEGEQITIVFTGLSKREPRAGQSRAHLYKVEVAGRPISAASVYDRLEHKTAPAPAPAVAPELVDPEPPLPF